MYETIDHIIPILKKIVPEPVVRPLRPLYHLSLSFFMALSYGFPARKLTVIGVTGTKGKSTTTEMVFSILRAAGHKTALISTIRFAIEDQSEPNMFKMTLQGRGFVQAFMSKALKAGCTHIVVEITSESVVQYRHWFLYLDGLIVTNIHREHIDSHGSMENYILAKREIVNALVRSNKPSRVLVANEDISASRDFLSMPVSKAIGFSEKELKDFVADDRHVQFEYEGNCISVPLPGAFSAMNALAALKLCEEFGVPVALAAEALAKLPTVRGRIERIEEGQDFTVIVDYAHTPDSLRALYGAFDKKRKICVLGNTGGGRDKWKRPVMGRIADEMCEKVILTNEDPYDEDPRDIIFAMKRDMRRTPEIVMDRREAIRTALLAASTGDVVLISGKGTDPFIMGKKGSKIPWGDAQVVREELKRLLS
jgi:UDP-N-acetylmuramoyl-L-alanyl-D-glutamate--2,6-diaminopimelate ligase